jgi:tetratricopeptide (TPR) repeat protein
MAAAVRARALSLLGDPAAGEAHAQALAAAGTLEDRARALRFYGADLMRADRFPEAISVLQEAVRTSQQVGEPVGRADALDLLGGALGVVGDVDRAITAHRTALALREVQGRPEGVAATLRRLGRVESRTAQSGRALGHLVAARAILRDAGLESRTSRLEVDLAEVRWRRGEVEHARRHLEAATDLTGRARARAALLDALVAEPEARPVATARALELCTLDRWRSGQLLAHAWQAVQEGEEAAVRAAHAELAGLRHAEFTQLVGGWVSAAAE